MRLWRLVPLVALCCAGAAEAGWQMVDGRDVWARQEMLLSGKGGVSTSTFPAWRPVQDNGVDLLAGVSLATESHLPTLLGGAQPSDSRVFVSARSSADDYSLQANLAYRFDNSCGKDGYTLQGSHAAYRLGNWFLGAGKLDWFWGPGWDSSLILQTPQEAPPALFLQRAVTEAPEPSWLHWIGPWNWQMFAGQLEGNRDHAEAKLLGARLTFQPFDAGLEIGISRTAMWGGEGRPESLSSLWNVIQGTSENCYSNCAQSEPGNQLGGFDLKYGFAAGDSRLSVYAQLTGEDEAKGQPSRNLYLAGADWSHPRALGGRPLTVFFEAADTMADAAVRSRAWPNVAYNHGIYTDGYRYKGQPLGSSYDSDSRSYVLGMLGEVGADWRWQLRLKHLELNRDGRGLNVVSPGRATRTVGAELGGDYRWQQLRFQGTLAAYDDKAYLDGSQVAAMLGMSLELP